MQGQLIEIPTVLFQEFVQEAEVLEQFIEVPTFQIQEIGQEVQGQLIEIPTFQLQEVVRHVPETEVQECIIEHL